MKKEMKAAMVTMMAAVVGLTGMGVSAEGATGGFCFYSYADTYTANARQSLENVAAAEGSITVSTADDQGDSSVQTSNMNNFLTQDVTYLGLTNIMPNSTSEICKQVAEAGSTLILFGCSSPSEEDFANYPNTWFVGSIASESGILMGEAVVDYWNENENADRNGNGKLDYIMLLGVQGSYDSEQRSTYAISTVTDAGIEVENLSGDQICNFSRAEAQEKVAALLANYGDDIDVIFSVNDDMALGAIQAMKTAGYLTDETNTIPVTGVDATEVGCQAVEEGTMLVTSLNNPVTMGKSLYKLMLLLEDGQEVTTESLAIEGATVEGHSILIDYTPITADNLADARYDITDTEL